MYLWDESIQQKNNLIFKKTSLASTRPVCRCRTNTANRNVWCDFFWRHAKYVCRSEAISWLLLISWLLFFSKTSRTAKWAKFRVSRDLKKFTRERHKKSHRGFTKNPVSEKSRAFLPGFLRLKVLRGSGPSSFEFVCVVCNRCSSVFNIKLDIVFGYFDPDHIFFR